ncbi:hypothetical protein KTAU_28670 [Thermogemmatispora aurantia]|uniref:hypothetical protein n=1 Tax=Thermogemmatispora aurantia TaxID=2045279 RepID=UPI00124EC3BE|nr:hypothetical protein [Thermogemmatispora aurantia]GER84231.1 hypothetical protein KTAU_28670 [Thermogemmatispora aurantia]
MSTASHPPEITRLASYRRCVERIHSAWPAFLERRRQRLAEQERYGKASEKVAENILEDLFTLVLDWELTDLNHQVQYADLVLTHQGIKYLLVEVKRPGALAWNRHAVERALEQARRYAAEQRVKCIAISDGVMLYAAHPRHGGLEDRVFVSLTDVEPPLDLWWLSVHGIYRPRPALLSSAGTVEPLRLLPEAAPALTLEAGAAELLHPKYRLPAACFAYVGSPSRPETWKLPYRLADGTIDERRLPKAIQAILSNYRGTKVSGIPEADIPAVLLRLAEAATSLGRMPHQRGDAAEIYRQLADALEQLGYAPGEQGQGSYAADQRAPAPAARPSQQERRASRRFLSKDQERSS